MSPARALRAPAAAADERVVTKGVRAQRHDQMQHAEVLPTAFAEVDALASEASRRSEARMRWGWRVQRGETACARSGRRRALCEGTLLAEPRRGTEHIASAVHAPQPLVVGPRDPSHRATGYTKPVSAGRSACEPPHSPPPSHWMFFCLGDYSPAAHAHAHARSGRLRRL